MNQPKLLPTYYKIAWEAFINTIAYKTAVQAMAIRGMKQPYIDNILRSAFDEGYNSVR